MKKNAQFKLWGLKLIIQNAVNIIKTLTKKAVFRYYVKGFHGVFGSGK